MNEWLNDLRDKEMTRDEILKMEAGRELDCMIAVNVMGWHKEIDDYGHPRWYTKDRHYACGINTDGMDDYEDGEDFHILHWHPSESILWAWEVVEKLAGDDWSLEFLCGDYRARFQTPNKKVEEQTYGIAIAETASLAICRAALLAVMEAK